MDTQTQTARTTLLLFCFGSLGPRIAEAMADSASTASTVVFCRKCLGFSARWVSRVGSSTPASVTDNAPTSTGRGGRYPVENSASAANANVAAMIVVLVGALLVLTGVMTIVMLLRRRRIREERLNALRSADVVVAAKGANGDEAQSEGGKWSAGTVELVVMAGETSPTFLAHPVPATPVIQCPPLMILPKDAQ